MTHFDPFRINYKTLGRMLYQRRTDQGLSLRDLAKLTSVSASTLCRVEGGKSIETGRFLAILNYLGTDVRKFMPAELLSGKANGRKS